MFGWAFLGGGRGRLERIDQLRRTRLFAGCSERQLALYARHLDEATYPAGAVIIREGWVPSSFNVILEGEVELSVAGRYRGRLLPGDCTDHLAMAGRRPAPFTARALSRVRALVASRDQFRALSGKPFLEQASVEQNRLVPARRALLGDDPA